METYYFNFVDLSKQQIEMSILRLIRMGFVEEENGTLVDKTTVNHELTTAAI